MPMSVEENRESRPVRKKRKLRWGRLVFVLLVLAVLLTGAFWGTVWIYDNFINPPKVDVVGASDKITQNEKLNKRINILLLGIDDGDSDAAPDEPKRTDAMMLASFDPGDNKVALLSLPRDTKVQIPGRAGWDKLNAAYAYGGVMMAKQTVANLLQVPIHYYVLVDWRAFIDVIDLIGGVDLYVEKDMYYEDPYADLVIDIKHGYQHLDGKRAGEYVRFRKDELGDIGRVQRQQKFMKAAAAQIFNIDTVTKIPALFSRFIDTAGIRQTNDTIENLGIERTFQKMDQAYVILWMIDSTDAQRRFEELKADILPHCEGKKMIILFNKSDLLLATQKEELSAIFADMKVEKLFISAKKRENITILEKKLVQAAALPEVNQNDIIITNVRHYEALTRALDSIHRVQEGLQLELSGDLVSEDLRQCIHELSEIVAEGGITSEETLQNIFQNFCIGK